MDYFINLVRKLFLILELEQIESDLYEEFAFRKKKKITKLENTKKPEIHKEKATTLQKKNTKYLNSEDNFPTLIPSQPESERYQKGNSKLKGLLNEDIQIKKQSSKQEVVPDVIQKHDTRVETQYNLQLPIRKENKLSAILSTSTAPKPKPKVDIFQKGLKKNRIDYDDEFPEL